MNLRGDGTEMGIKMEEEKLEENVERENRNVEQMRGGKILIGIGIFFAGAFGIMYDGGFAETMTYLGGAVSGLGLINYSIGKYGN